MVAGPESRTDVESFEDLGLAPALVEALAAEGIEVPTPLQKGAIPVARRGNNLVARAGPGAGVLVTYGAATLDRLASLEGDAVEAEELARGPRAVILSPTAEDSVASAECLARLALATGHTVAALEGTWREPEKAQVLFATPDAVLDAVRRSRVKLDRVECLVVDGAEAIRDLRGLESTETLLELLGDGAQRIVVSIPVSPEVEDLVARHVKKAVSVPPRAALKSEDGGGRAPRRGDLRYRLAAGTKEEETLRAVGGVLREDHDHALVFFRSEDRAADVGDHLALHGYRAGFPGDGESPVWLAAGDLEARRALEAADAPDRIATLSHDVPADPDALDRRHGAGGHAVVVVVPREMPHLRDVAGRTGYTLLPDPTPTPQRVAGELERLRAQLREALEEGGLGPLHLALEPLFEDYAPGEVAAAALRLLRESVRSRPGSPEPRSASAAVPSGRTAPAWVRLFVSIGERDGAGPGDLLGAVTGETGVDGSRVGKIDIRDTYSLLEVDEAVAEAVVRAVNGTTIKGRSARVDYDRGPGGRGRRPPGKSGR